MATKKNNTAIIALAGLALVGGGAFFYLQQQEEKKKDPKKKFPKEDPKKKDPKKKDPKKKDPKKKDPKKKDPPENPTIGSPFRAGRKFEQRNVVLAVSRNPVAHPNGRRRGAKQETWATDVAYFESYPRGPLVINPKSTKHRGYQRAWVRLRGYVREALKKAKTIPKVEPKKKLPKKKDKTHLTLGSPYKHGAEKKNSAIAVSRRPTSHPVGQKKRSNQSWEDWLTDVAYWESATDGPVSLSMKIKAHKPFVGVWLRVQSYVRAAIAAKKTDSKKTTPADPKTGDRMVAAKKVPDRGVEAANANWVTKTLPLTWTTPAPYDRWRGANDKQKFVDWLSNVAYYGSYPDAPVRLSGSSPKKWINAWIRINKLVKALAKRRGIGTPKVVPKKIPPTQKIPKADPAPGEPSTGIATGKADLNGAAEVRNSAIAVAKGYAKHKTKKDVKLTDEVFRITYPESPKKLDPKNGRHKKYVDAWVRIRNHVKRGLALRPKLKSDPLGASDVNWKAWAITMAATSGLRSRSKLAGAYAKAAKHYSSSSGSPVAKRDIGTKAGPHDVTLSGLMAEAAIRIPVGKLTEVTRWSKNPSRAFWATNGLF